MSTPTTIWRRSFARAGLRHRYQARSTHGSRARSQVMGWLLGRSRCSESCAMRCPEAVRIARRQWLQYSYTDFGEGHGRSPQPVLRTAVGVAVPGAPNRFAAIIDTGARSPSPPSAPGRRQAGRSQREDDATAGRLDERGATVRPDVGGPPARPRGRGDAHRLARRGRGA